MQNFAHTPRARSAAAAALAQRARTGINPNANRRSLGDVDPACRPGYGPGGMCRGLYVSVDQATVTVAAGATVIPFTPSETLFPTDFRIASTISPFFLINAINIGRTEQNLIAGGPVLAEVFSSASFYHGLKLDIMEGGTPCSVTVTNIDPGGTARRFSAVFIGDAMAC